MSLSTDQRASNRLTADSLPGTSQLTQRWYVATTIGTKVLIAITGLLFFLYLVIHLAGNLLFYYGPETFNAYAHFLIKNPLIVPLEIGIAATFIIHVYKAAANYLANRRARPVQYYQPMRRFFGWGRAGGTSRKSFASTTMIFSGIFILLFVIIHVYQFRLDTYYVVPNAGGEEIRDLYRTEIEVFKNAFNVVFYIFSLVVVGLHLSHGLSSSLSSLGVHHARYTSWVLLLGKVVAIILAAAFITIPLWVYFFGGA